MKSSRLSPLRGLLACALLLPVISALALEPGKPQNLTSPNQVPEGLAKSDWASIRAAYEAWRHAFQPVEGGWQARNPGQQWTTRFDGRGFLATPRDGAWTWGLELKSYGFGNFQTPVGATPPVVAAEGQRLSCQWDGTVQEWWVNDQRGLEHGYTVKERPARKDASELSFLLTTRGGLTPRISDDAKGVLFQDASGATVVNYTGLKVWDADGKVLASRFEKGSVPGSVRLHVAEAGARYPLTIDPIAQQAYLKASNTGAGDLFGHSVAVSGDTVVVGALGEDAIATGVNGTVDESASMAGAAYVFVRSGTTWSQQAYLKASNTGAGDWFGYSVAVSGDTVVVGAPLEDGSATGVNGTAAEGAPDSGAAYVYLRSGTTWSQQAYLKASNTGWYDYFGWSVAVSGSTVLVGSINEDGSATGVNGTVTDGARGSGAAYVFVRSGTAWSQQAYLKAHQVTPDDQFGTSVAVSGDTLVVGAPYDDGSATGVNGTVDEGTPQAGAAYVFVRSGTTWSQQAYLKAHQVTPDDQFGTAVAVSGDTLMVGAPYEDGSATGVNGTVDEGAPRAGAAYVFVRSGTTWSQQAYLKAHQVTPDDQFGTSVAVSGDTVVVGANKEDGSATGVNGPVTEGASSAGAAYVYVRSGTTWSQQAYLKAHQIMSAEFGYSVAVSGDTVVAGARSATGGNGPVNGEASASGAAYIFTGVGPAPPSALNDWIASTGLTGNDALPLAAPHGDGVANLQKCAFNLNGAAADTRILTPGTGTAGLPVISVAGTASAPVLRVEFLRRTTGGLIYTPQKNSGLSAPWQPLTDMPTVTSLDATWERVVYEEPVTGERWFARVQVEMP